MLLQLKNKKQNKTENNNAFVTSENQLHICNESGTQNASNCWSNTCQSYISWNQIWIRFVRQKGNQGKPCYPLLTLKQTNILKSNTYQVKYPKNVGQSLVSKWENGACIVIKPRQVPKLPQEITTMLLFFMSSGP